jgi:hypothetical protein
MSKYPSSQRPRLLERNGENKFMRDTKKPQHTKKNSFLSDEDMYLTQMHFALPSSLNHHH